MRRNTAWRWASAAALIILAACAGPRPPASLPAVSSSAGAAIVRGGPALESYLFGRGHVTITRIDDTPLVDGDNNPLYGVIEVAAGRHAVYFVYRHAGLCVAGTACALSLLRERKLALDARAGHVYRVGASYRDGRLWAWITDQSDRGRLVAGDLPAGDNWAARARGFGSDQQF